MLVSRMYAPVRQQTLSNLRTAIIEGHFKPGECLIERDLCKLTGVSRTSVREALRQLESEGLVKVIAQRGVIVATIKRDEARDLCEVRQVLEGLASRLFAERATSSQVLDLARVVKLLGKASRKGNVKDIIRSKNKFYSIILEGCGNKTIYSPIILEGDTKEGVSNLLKLRTL